jgi:hypothetical protein
MIFSWTVARRDGRYDLVNKSVKTNQHAFSTGKLDRFGGQSECRILLASQEFLVSSFRTSSHKVRNISNSLLTFECCCFKDPKALL